MKKDLILLLINISLCFQLSAQYTGGITNSPDTSYANWSAYQKDKKYHPQISLAARIVDSTIAEENDIVYCDLFNRTLVLDAFYPVKKVKEKRTAVVIIHGGGWRSGNRAQHHPLAQRLASLGYVVFTPEYRLSTEALYPAAVFDVKSAVKWVRANALKYNINADAIAIAGFSAGGELAAFVGNTNRVEKYDGNSCSKQFSSKVNAIIDLDGTLSFVHAESGEGDESKRPSAGTLWFGYSKNENKELWTEASPLTHAGKNSVPTLFINSSVDRMHAGRDDYIKLLNKYHIYTEVHSFKDAPHSFVLYNPWFEPMVSYIDGFLKKIFNRHER